MHPIRDCAIIIKREAEKLELSSKNVDSTPPPKQKKLVLAPLCYVKNNVAPPSPTTIAAVQDTSPETNSNAVRDGILRPYSSEPKWKDKKFGFVPDAKRRISLFGNKLLPDFYESFKVRAGSNVQLMKRMFIAERDRQYNIVNAGV